MEISSVTAIRSHCSLRLLRGNLGVGRRVPGLVWGGLLEPLAGMLGMWGMSIR